MTDTYLVDTIFAHETEIARLRECLEKIESAAILVVRQTNAESAYALHDKLIEALEKND